MPSENIFSIDTFTNYTSSDYNGFYPNPEAEYSFVWKSPPFDELKDYTGPREERKFASLKEYSEATGQDANSIIVDYDIFENVSRADTEIVSRVYKAEILRVEALGFPFKPTDGITKICEGDEGDDGDGGDVLDFRLKPNSVAVDAGCILPNINDGFSGRAPDLGALEAGQPLPVYGPRLLSVQGPNRPGPLGLGQKATAHAYDRCRGWLRCFKIRRG